MMMHGLTNPKFVCNNLFPCRILSHSKFYFCKY